ncbi:S-layer homology domain [Syntrophomonas zehnderi OL-4]|uniref:S-layer homology domain n=1 Tax=Syntrophomonas zehnderi OL-4 TaxID=690567 RepID=A0A0E4G9Z4_9FIRM|nr:YcdB/YcdC domain-containing protein [Syntrophomonas zehnderi]CFX17044.1 S-layer homology domain [Syntrophomonas zehnderi OL-4]
MPKILVILMTLFFLVGMPYPVAPLDAAEPNLEVVQADKENRAAVSQEEAWAVLQAAFPEIMAGQELDAEYSEQGLDGASYWEFQLKDETGVPNGNYSLRATVNALTGEITAMQYNPLPAYYQGKTVALNRQQAYQVADEFVKKIQPDKVAELVFLDTNQSSYYPRDRLNTFYNFTWNRQNNGMVVDWDSISVGVDAITGKVTRYSYVWHNANFPPAGTTISPQEITAKLLDEIGLYPSYTTQILNRESIFLRPIYSLNTNAQFFDVNTGEALKGDGTRIAKQDARIFETIPEPQKNTSRLERPVQAAASKMNPDQAKKVAEEAFKKMGITGEIRRSGGGTSSGLGYQEEFWHYSLVDNKSSNRFGNGPEIGIDVHTGFIHQYNNYAAANGGGENSITYATALQKAQEAIKLLNPEKQNQFVLCNQLWDEEPADTYHFYFNRLVNGISCPGGIRAEINKYTGSLINYWVNWPPYGFSALENMISPAQAESIYKEQQPFQLAYIFPADKNGAKNQRTEPLLVYRYAPDNKIDALSGEMLGRGEVSLNLDSAVPAGHPAAPALSLLQESGLLPAGIQPEAAVTRRQALKTLMASIQPNYYSSDLKISLALKDINVNDPDEVFLQKAVRKGVIKNQGYFDPDKIISREELAVWLVNCLDYQDVARMKNQISNPYKDADRISKDKTNYVGLVDGLGLLTADANQNFRPQDAVSWAELAVTSTRLATMRGNQSRY